MTLKDFVRHCKALRELGAVSVSVEGDKLSATFATPAAAVRVPVPREKPERESQEPLDPKKARQAQRDVIMEMARANTQ